MNQVRGESVQTPSQRSAVDVEIIKSFELASKWSEDSSVSHLCSKKPCVIYNVGTWFACSVIRSLARLLPSNSSKNLSIFPVDS